MQRLVSQAGEAPVAEVWRRYADLDAWSTWAPFIVAVSAPGRELTPGLTGTVVAVGGLQVGFEVLAVDPAGRSWQWRAHLGPLALTLDHEVLARPGGGSVAVLRLDGWAPVVLAYQVPALIALASLVRP